MYAFLLVMSLECFSFREPHELKLGSAGPASLQSLRSEIQALDYKQLGGSGFEPSYRL